MAKFLATIKAIITRLVFASHGFIAIWQVTTFKKNPYFWYLSCPIVLLFFEGVFTLTIKDNQEWKWFCPSVFLYLSSVVPAIWLLELDKVDRRLKSRGSNINISENFDLSNLAASDLKHLEEALGVDIRLPDIQISTETWVTLIEQFLMLILIIGRWMLPKGDLTRDQLSQLLLVYIGTAADIIEFFDSFKEDRIAREPVLVYLTLGIWAWSLMQFTVVLTATKSRKSRLSSGIARKKVRTETSCCSIDVWGIALNMILQDGPFLAFRLILIIHYQIVSYMNIFFTCKNTLVILLQLYRLYVVQTESKSKRHKKYNKIDVSNISIISRGDMYKDVRMRSSRDNRHKNRRDKDIEANYTETEDSEEDIDKFDSSPKHVARSKRKNRQDTGYSTSSSRNSNKHDKSHKHEGKKKSSRKEESRRGTSDERHKRREDRKSSEKNDRKSRAKSDNYSDRSSNRKFDSENESLSEELTESKTVSENSESESDRKSGRKHAHRKRRQDRD